MNKDYVKVIYESNPIGKEKIILYLTTFDIEAFKKDEALAKIPEKRIAKAFYIPEKIVENRKFAVDYNACQDYKLRAMIEKFIVDTYEKQIMEMKQELEFLRNIKIVPIEYGDKNV